MKYVVVVEGTEGYMECAGICDSEDAAFGKAYLWLAKDEPSEKFYVTTPEVREGENGYIIYLIEKETGKEKFFATVLEYEDGS